MHIRSYVNILSPLIYCLSHLYAYTQIPISPPLSLSIYICIYTHLNIHRLYIHNICIYIYSHYTYIYIYIFSCESVHSIHGAKWSRAEQNRVRLFSSSSFRMFVFVASKRASKQDSEQQVSK